MLFARPPEGFKITYSDTAERQLIELSKIHPRLHFIWEGVEKRLAFTGHRDGTRVKNYEERNLFVFAHEFGPQLRVQTVFTILGDVLKFQSIMIRGNDTVG